jgi:hypothetical protein
LAALITRETVATFDSIKPKRSGNDWFDIRPQVSAANFNCLHDQASAGKSLQVSSVHFRVLMP